MLLCPKPSPAGRRADYGTLDEDAEAARREGMEFCFRKAGRRFQWCFKKCFNDMIRFLLSYLLLFHLISPCGTEGSWTRLAKPKRRRRVNCVELRGDALNPGNHKDMDWMAQSRRRWGLPLLLALLLPWCTEMSDMHMEYGWLQDSKFWTIFLNLNMEQLFSSRNLEKDTFSMRWFTFVFCFATAGKPRRPLAWDELDDFPSLRLRLFSTMLRPWAPRLEPSWKRTTRIAMIWELYFEWFQALRTCGPCWVFA